MNEDISRTATKAVKWSFASEAAAKIIIPVTQLVLARILAPEIFGVLAIVVMITSFAEMLADAGFQKYLIQYEFSDKRKLYEAANVAFWSSMFIAILLLALIVVLRDNLASLVGSPELGLPIAIAALSLPISVFVSTQQALFRRAFEYKRLLPIRVVVATIPLVVSVPLALAGFGYWSLLAGTLAASLYNAVAMTVISEWKPRWSYSVSLLRRMFSFSGWSLLEAISIWATIWSGTFVVGTLLTPYELGLYRQPILVVNSVFALITNATTPVLFAALSRLQNNMTEYRRFFFSFQYSVAIMLFPIGVGAFFYRDFFTSLLFGPKWADAALMFGCWAFVTSLGIVFSHYCSEVFRSLGKPRVSFLSQCLYMCVMIPAIYIAASESFSALVIVNSAVRFIGMGISQLLMYLTAGFGFLQVMKNLYAPLLSALIMGIAAFYLSNFAGGKVLWSAIGIIVCALIYIGVSLSFPRSRKVIFAFAGKIYKRNNRVS
ncbi:oligosaccharide flippase family protein [Glutamicibacter sp.]|uniref:oligosaccharide flippase family protein n=1 Tax=Glutamicibacter sp. TaxID=1931995 RepID=UPI0028BE7800|nr:oligosaccharide flippase family protein [Glutamicibacter sp.]